MEKEKINHISNFKICYIAPISKMPCICWGTEKLRQWDRKESSEIDLHVYVQLVFDKDEKVIQYRKCKVFNKGLEE